MVPKKQEAPRKIIPKELFILINDRNTKDRIWKKSRKNNENPDITLDNFQNFKEARKAVALKKKEINEQKNLNLYQKSWGQIILTILAKIKTKMKTNISQPWKMRMGNYTLKNKIF